jgi:DNA-binding NtrC family response regulator
MRTRRILVVEDEVNARDALAELLREEGYTVAIASNAQGALAQLEAFAPHLLLIDVRMPGTDGISLMRTAQANYRDLAAVVMTAYGACDTALSELPLGVAGYVTKPIELDQLLVVIERVLSAQRSAELCEVSGSPS